MAEGAISFLLSTIAPMARNEFNLLGGVRDEIEFIRDELEIMNAAMQVAGAKEDTDPLFDVWVKQVRDTAYDAGDVLEQFIFHLEYCHDGGFSEFLSRSSSFIKTIFVRHRIASEIQRIKLKVEEVSQRKLRYTHFNNVQTSSSSNIAPSSTEYDSRHDALLLRESEVVGITGPKTELINWLVDGKFHETRVLSVCGMGGLGKTTLVKKIYDDPLLVKHFQSHAWINVSKSLQTKEILKEIIKILNKENKLAKKLSEKWSKKLYGEVEEDDPVEGGQMELITQIQSILEQKKYVIVLDDVRDKEAWHALKHAFPSNNLGSRVILTTRNNFLASIACNESNGKVHNLLQLPDDQSRTLFCRKAFRGNECPSNLTEIMETILNKCEGLPLAIVAIGGLLATKGQRIDEWNKISRGLRAELQREGRLANLENAFSLSYFDLPWHLKLCFLYLSIFPEDYSIDHWRLIRLWIAEGFVLPTNSKLTEEEVAGSYLTELTDRSLIQIKRVGLDGRVKEYHIHNIWRELIICRSSKHDLVTIYRAQQNNFTQRVRRLAIHNETGNWQEFKCRATHIRSLLMFGSEDLESMSSIGDSLGDGAKLLKVLDMRNQGLQTFPRKIGQLLHLKYLSLRGNKRLEEIPKSIGNLQMLETLDLKYTGVRKLPKEILKLHRLRHLLVGDGLNGFITLKGMEKLLCLEKLCTIKLKNKRNNNDILTSISKLTRLRKVDIMGLKSGNAEKLCSTIEKLTELRSLYIFAVASINLEHLSSPPKFLQTLGVKGYMEKLPEWIASLHDLTKLELRECRLMKDPLVQLQNLPNLTYLILSFDAYSGEELCFNAGTFKQLVTLGIFLLNGLKHVSVMEGTMPRLKGLFIGGSQLMEKVPSGIETLSSLSRLEFYDMSAEFKSKLKGELEKGNASKFGHIPIVCIDTEVFYVKSEASTSYS